MALLSMTSKLKKEKSKSTPKRELIFILSGRINVMTFSLHVEEGIRIETRLMAKWEECSWRRMALEMGEQAMNRGVCVAPEAGKDKKTDSPLAPPERNAALLTPYF